MPVNGVGVIVGLLQQENYEAEARSEESITWQIIDTAVPRESVLCVTLQTWDEVMLHSTECCMHSAS